jgi:uncharacterized SAM-binding protein YcdF (DUF218 family)
MNKRLGWLILLVVLILTLYFSRALILTALGQYLLISDQPQPADIIIVLGGDSNGGRVSEAVKLFKQGLGRKLLMSGGPLVWRQTHAQNMIKQAEFLGVPEQKILLEERSRSTWENALFSLPLVKKAGAHSVLIVTSPSHTRRSSLVFKRLYPPNGIKVLVCPVRDDEFKAAGWWQRDEDTEQVIREYLSLVYYWLKGYN